jgi:hypothetical protein
MYPPAKQMQTRLRELIEAYLPPFEPEPEEPAPEPKPGRRCD